MASETIVEIVVAKQNCTKSTYQCAEKKSQQHIGALKRIVGKSTTYQMRMYRVSRDESCAESFIEPKCLFNASIRNERSVA